MNKEIEALKLSIEALKEVFKILKPYSTEWIGVQAVILLCESALKTNND